jgi:threonine aldolase
MATLLRSRLLEVPKVEILFPTESNSVFLNLAESVHDLLKEKGWKYYTFIGSGGARIMCSWNTTKEEIDELVSDIRLGLK